MAFSSKNIVRILVSPLDVNLMRYAHEWYRGSGPEWISILCLQKCRLHSSKAIIAGALWKLEEGTLALLVHDLSNKPGSFPLGYFSRRGKMQFVLLCFPWGIHLELKVNNHGKNSSRNCQSP